MKPISKAIMQSLTSRQRTKFLWHGVPIMSMIPAEERAYARKAGRGLIHDDITRTIGNRPLVSAPTWS